MNYWITTDTHLGHSNLVYKMKIREEGFEDKILKGFNKIRSGDVLIHLGDICFGKSDQWYEHFKCLDCYKWLTLGNHDRNSIQWYLNHGWDFAGESFTLQYMGHKILFSHVPKPLSKDNYTINIHGHFHNTDPEYHEPYLVEIRNDFQYLLALENNNYQLFNLKEVLRDFEKRCK